MLLSVKQRFVIKDGFVDVLVDDVIVIVKARWSDRPLSKVSEEKVDVGRVVNMLSISVVDCCVIRVGVDMVSCRL